jgi:hypothetical protein
MLHMPSKSSPMKKLLSLVIVALATFTNGGVFAQAAYSAPTACMVEFKKVADDAEKIYLDGLAKKIINPTEAAAYKKREEALAKKFKDAVTDKKLTLAECTALLKTANDEKAAVIKIATPK